MGTNHLSALLRKKYKYIALPALLFFFLLTSFTSFSQNKTDSLEKLLPVSKEDTAKVNLLNDLTMEHIYAGSGKALTYAEEALALSKKLNYLQGEASTNRKMAVYYYYNGDYKNTMEFFKKALAIYESLNDTAAISSSYSNIGGVQLSLGNYSAALEDLLKALRLAESIPENSPAYDKGSISKCYNNIGLVYYNLKNLPMALEYHRKSLKIKQELNDKLGIAAGYQNIGMVYDDQEKDSLAIENYNEALKIFRELNVKNGEAQVLINIGSILKRDKENQYGLNYFIDALAICESTGELSGTVAAYINIADCYFNMERYDIAHSCFLKALPIAEDLGDKEKKSLVLKGLAAVNSKMGKFEKAFHYLQLHASLKDTLYNDESSKQIAEMQTKYDTEKKDSEIQLLNKDKEIQTSDLKKQKIIIYSVIAVLLLAFALIFFVYRSYKQKKSAHRQLEKKNEEILLSKKEIEQKHEALSKANSEIMLRKREAEEKSEEILSSIRYAKRIQMAMLKEEEKVSPHLPDHFVLFKPKDIVSGDFYWAAEKNNYWYVAAADCTGHGVPGAFLTMLGMSFLNEITISSGLLKPSEILNELRNRVIKELGQAGREGEGRDGSPSETLVKDGMDISICALNLKTMEMEWAGANNSLYLVRKTGEGNMPGAYGLKEIKADLSAVTNPLRDKRSEFKLFEAKADLSAGTSVSKDSKTGYRLYEMKADKQPVGYFPDPHPFTNHKLQLRASDAIYIFTDGYADQFGGARGKKFKYSQLENLLQAIQGETMHSQKRILNDTIEKWRGNLEQIDDICIIGIKV